MNATRFPRFDRSSLCHSVRIGALVLAAAATALPTMATDYPVAGGAALPTATRLVTGDSITLSGNPAGLTADYKLNANSITLQSNDISAFRTLSRTGGTKNLITITGGVTDTFANIIFNSGSNTGSATDGGALVISGGSGTTTLNGNMQFTNNWAGRYGGAVADTGSQLVFNGSVAFINNTSVKQGGGIYTGAGNDLAFNGSSYFMGNTSTLGGAISVNGGFYIAGSSTFTNNSAFGDGGAIYVNTSASGTFDATNGDITFIGNVAGVTGSTSGTANAITIKNTAAPAITFNTGTSAAAAHTLYFYDPIATANSGVLATTISQNGNGTVVFDTYQSAIIANATINSGTFKLTRGATFGINKTSGTFTLSGSATLSGNGTLTTNTINLNTGATLEVLGGNTLKLNASTYNYNPGLQIAGSGTLDAGAPLSVSTIRVGTLTPDNPDVRGAPAVRTAPQTLALVPSSVLNVENGGTLNFNFFTTPSSDLLAVDTLTLSGTAFINMIGSGTGGTYKIITANTSLASLNLVPLINGIASGGRFGAIIDLTQNSGLEAWITLGSHNLAMVWAGATGTTWQNSLTANANWSTPGSSDTYFASGDRVTFDSTAVGKNITVDAAGVMVADMTVNNTAGNDYTFTGPGGIVGSTGSSVGLISVATGKLVKQGAGTLNFANTAANNFSGGIELSGGTLSFTAANQLGDGGMGIHFTDNATLSPGADALTLANDIIIDPAKTATLDTGTNTLILSGTLTGNTTAALVKTGSGALTLTGNNSAFAASTTVQQGSLMLANGAQLGGTVSIASDGLFGGSGTSTGDIVFNHGGILEVGTTIAVPGMLTLNNLTLDTTTLHFDLFNGGTSDSLMLTGVLTGALSSNTLAINSGVSGTFNLGNIAALQGATITVDGQALSTTSRSQATTSISGSNLMLIVGADMSRIMTWTGSTDAQWNATNWTDGDSKNLFANGDSIIFNGTTDAASPANRTIDVTTGGVIASDILVQGNASYTFNGDSIITDADSVVTGTLTGATGKLTKTGTGTLTFANAENAFNGGIDLDAGIIAFSNGNQLTTSPTTGITFTNSATLAATAATTLANTIVIAAGKNGTLDTGINTLTYTGTLIAGDTAATLVKTGAGILAFTTDNSAYTGQTAVSAGALLLTGTNANLGGLVTTASSATFGGAGNVTGTVNALAGSTLQVGATLTGTETLIVNNLTLNDGALLAGSGTLLGKATLLGNATAIVGATQNLTLAGITTGTGNLTKIGAGTLTYSGAASLGNTGATIIDAGIVALKNIANPTALTHTFTLDGGWLSLSATGTLNEATVNDWTSLIFNSGTATGGGVMGANDRITYTQGGTVAYNIGGTTATQQGIFVVIDSHASTVTLTGSNTYRGTTRIDSGTLAVTGNNQLGASTGTIALNGGILQLAASAINVTQTIELRTNTTIDIIYTGTGKIISGPITKLGSAPVTLTLGNSQTINATAALTLTGSNAADALHVNPYLNVTAQNIAAAGKGVVTVDNNSTFKYLNVSGTVANSFTGQGLLGITGNSTVTLTGANDIASINITGNSNTVLSTVIAANPNALGNASTSVTASNGAIIFAAPTNNVANVLLNGQSSLGFIKTPGTYRQASIATLNGAGMLTFNTNIAAGTADYMSINGKAFGTYTIIVDDPCAAPADPSTKIKLLDIAGGNATFTLRDTHTGKDHIDAGAYAYTLDTSSANGGFAVSLVNTPGQYSNAANVIKGMAGAMPLSWFSELDSVNNRMGEIRLDSLNPNRKITTWMRGYGRRLNVKSSATGLAFDEQQFGADAGADYKAIDSTSNLFIGAFIGYGQSTRDFDTAGTARSDSAYAGAYITLSKPSGWYLDAVVKGNQFKNRINAVDSGGNPVNANFNNNGVGASLEGGKYMTLPKGWFLEPQIQGQYATISGQSYTTSNNINASIDRANSAQTRAGLLFGRVLINTVHDRLQVYAKIHGAYQWVTGGNVYANNRYIGDPKIEGSRIEAGGGLAWTMLTSTQMYLDYQYANATDYTKPWSTNFGIRYSW